MMVEQQIQITLSTIDQVSGLRVISSFRSAPEYIIGGIAECKLLGDGGA